MKGNFWKITTFILLILTILVSYQYFKEYKRNLPYKKELINLQKILEKTKNESDFLKIQTLKQKDPLNLEKEKKDKFGEANEGEKVILVSDELLKSIDLNQISR